MADGVYVDGQLGRDRRRKTKVTRTEVTIYYHCANSAVIPNRVKLAALDVIKNADIEFEAVPDLCKLSAKRDSALKQWAKGETIKIVACYLCAVKCFFFAGRASLDVDEARNESRHPKNEACLRAAVLVGIMMLAAGAKKLQAASIYIPNASFESPETTFASANIDSWQKPAKPWWYDESGGFLWSQLTGVFLNVPATEPDYIDNCDGKQAVWLFAVPEVELFQDLTATFEVGQSYHLTVGIFGGGGNMKDDVPIEIRLYYRDAENNKVTVGATTFKYDWDTGYVRHLNDVQLDIPQVTSTNSWAGKNIGVQLVSTLTLADLDPNTGRAGGYWVLDNVRLKTLPGPDFTGDSFVNLEDFAVMVQEWLSCTQTTTDLTGDGYVNMEDLMILVESWLESM